MSFKRARTKKEQMAKQKKLSRKQRKKQKKAQIADEVKAVTEPIKALTSLSSSVATDTTEPKQAQCPDDIQPQSLHAAPRQASPLWMHLGILAFLALLVSAAYSNSLHAPFHFDDRHNIYQNPAIQIDDVSFKSLRRAATESPTNMRWLPNASFAINYYFGKQDTTGYHAVNIAIHIITGWLVYLLFVHLLGLHALAEWRRNRIEVAALATALWVAHPLQTNAVTYLVQRMTSMAALFCILTLLLYSLGRRNHSGWRCWFLYGAALLSAFCAMVSKENSYMLPLLVVAYEVYFLATATKKTPQKRRQQYMLIVGGLLVVLLLGVLTGRLTVAGFMSGYSARDFTMTERLLTETRVMFLYLSLLLCPLPSRLNLAYEFPLSTSFLSPPSTVLAIIGLLVLVGFVFYWFRQQRLLSFALLWFLANLVIESSIIPLELVFEHRMYLPSVFLLLAVIAIVYRLAAGRWLWVVRSCILGLVLLLAVFTWQRNYVWQDGIRLWSDVLTKAPTSGRANIFLGEFFVKESRFDEALHCFFKALTLKHPPHILPHIYNNIGFSYMATGRNELARQYLEKSIRLDPNSSTARLNLALVNKKLNSSGEPGSQHSFKHPPINGLTPR
jgi:hypothetical protein